MSTKASIVAIAALLSVLAAPALAGDANAAAVLRDSVGANAPQIGTNAPQRAEPWRANARVLVPATVSGWRDRAPATARSRPAIDLNLHGHN